jgi:hypothetical protein
MIDFSYSARQSQSWPYFLKDQYLNFLLLASYTDYIKWTPINMALAVVGINIPEDYSLIL